MSATNVAQRKFCYTTQTQTFPLNCYYSQWSEVDRDSAKQFSPMVLFFFFFFSFSKQFHSDTTIFAAARDLTTPKFHFPCFHGSASGGGDFEWLSILCCRCVQTLKKWSFEKGTWWEFHKRHTHTTHSLHKSMVLTVKGKNDRKTHTFN